MGLLDDPFRDVAETLIDTFADEGDKVTITRTSETYVKGTGAESTASSTVSVKASPPSSYRAQDIDGDSIQKGDLRLMVAAKALESADSTFGQPNPDTDTLTRGGITYRIVSVEPMAGAGSDVAYQLQLRRGGGRA